MGSFRCIRDKTREIKRCNRNDYGMFQFINFVGLKEY